MLARLMGAVLRPRIVRFERCLSCGAIVWRCRVRRDGTLAIDPQPSLTGIFDVLSRGVLGSVDSGNLVPRYTLHVWVCPELRRRSHARHLQATLEWEVSNAIEEARRPRPPQQLSLLPASTTARRRRKEGWIDLTEGFHRGPPDRPSNGVVVVDLTIPAEPPRPN
jgi:hypothetical protein